MSLEQLNNTHRAIKFTRENILNDQLDFLDVLIKKKNNKLLTTVYRKTTLIGHYLNFQFYCSHRRKVVLINIMHHRDYNICSPEFLNDEINIYCLLNDKEKRSKSLV